MATDSERVRFQPGDGTENSTQRGCTPWLLLSCIILTSTTAFVFGWGLGAPNMYNRYTEVFLKNEDACMVDKSANSIPVVPRVLENDNGGENNQQSNTAELPGQSNEKPTFDFVFELQKGIPQTIFLIGAFIGALTGPMWVQIMDRKRTVFVNYIFCFASSLCVLLAYYFKNIWLFYISRALLGYQGGMACVVVPPFIGEISSLRIRGITGGAFQLALTLGILVAQVVGLPIFAGTCTGWGWGLSIVFLLPLAGIFPLVLIPNSPTQMVAKYTDEEQATRDLKKLRGINNVQADLEMIREQTRQASGKQIKSLSILQIAKNPRYRWPMLTTIVLQTAQALSGINAVFFYSSKMFEKAGIPIKYIPYANIGTGIMNVLVTIISLSLIERIGRRALIIYPMSVMVVVFAILTALVQLNETRNNAVLGLISVIFILIFIICFAVGLGPIPFLYSTEVCRPEIRDSVQSVGLSLNYLGNILLSLFFPALNSVLGGYVFLIFLVLVALCVAFFVLRMPETMGLPIEEVEKFWKIPPPPTEDKLLEK